jgi:hypothetical protein
MKFTRNKTINILLILLVSIFIIILIILNVGINSINEWNKIDIITINCTYSKLLKIKDVEGNNFVFEDIDKNSNLKTNYITFNENKLGIKSLASIKNSNLKLNYLSKNEQLTYKELLNIQNCFEPSLITISNDYNFDKINENKFCQFKLIENEKYETVFCE